MSFTKEDAMKLKAAIVGSDKSGNRIDVSNYGHITLKLHSESRGRDIGQIKSVNSHLHYIKHLKKKHRFRKADAWGLNDHIVQCLPDETIVMLIIDDDGGRTYTTTVSAVKEHGDYLWFKSEGFERQIFMSLDKFE